jgi:quercetin dioxygenase-like cupin family protein
MIFLNREAVPVEMLPGLTRRTLADGPELMLCEFTFESGVQIPTHTHPHEQLGYVVRGEVRMTIDGKDSTLTAGDSYYIPGDLPHSAFTLAPSTIVDCFTPPREDYRHLG